MGAKALTDEPTLGINTSGRISEVAGRPGTDGADGFHVFFAVRVQKPPKTLVGASVRVTIPIKTTGTAGVTVPLSAVSLAPDGRARVQRDAGRKLEFVPVETGLSADGYVSVTPRKGRLAPGDLVVIGSRKGRGAKS